MFPYKPILYLLYANSYRDFPNLSEEPLANYFPLGENATVFTH